MQVAIKPFAGWAPVLLPTAVSLPTPRSSTVFTHRVSDRYSRHTISRLSVLIEPNGAAHGLEGVAEVGGAIDGAVNLQQVVGEPDA